MLTGDWGDLLLDRTTALEEIEGALHRARLGSGSLLVIEGGAGEGKTALLDAARRQANGTAVTAVDDAHRLSRPELQALAARALNAESDPEVVLVAFRGGEPDADETALDELRTAYGARRLHLSPLGPEAVTEFVRRRLPDAPDGLCEAVHDRTGGNPLYLEELLAGDPTRRHLLSVGDRVLRRAASLGAEAVPLAGAVAVLGEERLAVAARVAEIDLERARVLAHRLRRMAILAGEDPPRFAQPLVRASVKEALTSAERHALHARSAAALREENRPPADVAEHLAALIPERSSEVAAGLAAAAAAAPESAQAIGWLRRALQENASHPPRSELLQLLGQVELLARDPTAIGHLQEALTLTSEPAARARMGIALAEVLAYAGRWEEMLSLMGSVEDDVAIDTEEVQVQFASVRAVATAHDAARVHLFDRDRERLEDLSRGSSWAAHALGALLASVGALRGESPEAVHERAERAVGDGILLGEQGGGGWAAPHLLASFVVTEADERALVLCDAVEAASGRLGAATGVLVATGYRAWVRSRRGELVRAESDFRRALALIPDQSMQMLLATFLFLAVDILVERPGLGDLEPTVETVQLEPAFRNTWSGGMHLWVRGRLRLVNRDRAGGIEDLRAVGRIATPLGFGPSLVPWRSFLALALAPAEREEALALVGEELKRARTAGLPRAEGVALRALGILTPGEPGIEHLRAAVDILRPSSARLELGRTLVELGVALRRERRSAESREPLRQGLELAVSCGAVRLATRAREELGAAAGRPPRQSAGDQTLTPSELRVARLAAAGSSSPEIAGELYVSVKTVETHLSHIYAKLGLAGRGARKELPAALEPYRSALAEPDG